MQELIELWERRVKHYEKLIDTTINPQIVWDMQNTSDVFILCIDELKRTLAAEKENEK